MVIEFGRQVCGSLAESAVARVAGGRRPRRLRDGHRRGAAHPPLPRPADGRRQRGDRQRRRGREQADARPRGARSGARRWATAGPAGDRRVGGGAVDPAGHRELETFTLDRRPAPLAVGRSATSSSSASSRCCTGAPPVAVRHRLVAAAGRVDAGARRRCAPGATGTATAMRGADPTVEATADGFVFEHAYRVPGPEWTPGGSWYRGVPARAEADRGLADVEDLWAAGRVHRRRSRPGETAGRARLGRRPGRPRRRRPRRSSRRPGTGRRSRPRRAPRDEVDGSCALRRRPVRGRDGDRADGGRRLSVVRRVVARHDDVVRGPVPRAPGARGGPRAPRCGPRRRCRRGCWPTPPTPAGSSTTPPTARCGSSTRSAATSRRPATSTSPPSSPAPSTAIVDAHVAGTRYGIRVDPGDGLLTQGAAGLGADLDGRARRRAAGHPARGQGGRDQRAVDQRARHDRRPHAATRPRTPDGGRRCTTAPGDRSQARSRRRPPARRGRRAGPGDDAPSGPTSCSPRRCRTPPSPDRDRRQQRPGRDRRRVVRRSRAELLTLARAALALARRSRATSAPPRRPGRARSRVPPGHGLAVADRAVRRRCAAGAPAGVLDGLIAHLGEWGLGSVSETADGDAPHARDRVPVPGVVGRRALRARRAVRG